MRGDFFGIHRKRHQNIAGLLFADDLALLGRNIGEMEKLLHATSEFGSKMGITFNPQKSAIVKFSGRSTETSHISLLQGKELPMASSCKYLGITLSDSKNYLDIQEKN